MKLSIEKERKEAEQILKRCETADYHFAAVDIIANALLNRSKRELLAAQTAWHQRTAREKSCERAWRLKWQSFDTWWINYKGSKRGR